MSSNVLDQDLGDPSTALQKSTYVLLGFNFGLILLNWLVVKCTTAGSKQQKRGREEEEESFIVQ